MTSITFTKAEYASLRECIANTYMDFNEDEAQDYEIENYKALVNLSNKMLRAINKKGTWYLYQLIDTEKPATTDNIKEKYRL